MKHLSNASNMEVMLLSHHTLLGLVILCNFVATPLLELSISSHFCDSVGITTGREEQEKTEFSAASPAPPQKW